MQSFKSTSRAPEKKKLRQQILSSREVASSSAAAAAAAVVVVSAAAGAAPVLDVRASCALIDNWHSQVERTKLDTVQHTLGLRDDCLPSASEVSAKSNVMTLLK